MGSAAERLLSLVEAEDRHDIPHADLAPLQLEAANEPECDAASGAG